MQTPSIENPPKRSRLRRLGQAIRWITALAALIAMVGWGYFAVTTIVPNPNNQTSVYGAFQANHPGQWQDKYNLPPGSTVAFIFIISYVPNGAGGCNGFYPNPPARNGSIVAFCYLPRPNSTLTSMIRDYLSFNVQADLGCCFGQPPLRWTSGPSGNLTGFNNPFLPPGELFNVSQEGNYTAHISNTHYLPYPAYAPEWINETLTLSDGYVQFSRPYFTAGIETFGVAAAFMAALMTFSLYSFSQRRGERRARDQDSDRRTSERILPPEVSD